MYFQNQLKKMFTMAKIKKISDLPFYSYLHLFYKQNKGTIKRNYKRLSKKFLDFNDPEKGKAFLRQPQFEALEMYIFLKEYLENQHLTEIFTQWYNKSGKFELRELKGVGTGGQLSMFEQVDKNTYKKVFAAMEEVKSIYPNYIFALTMGLGKTILMATTIFYEFLLANKFPKSPNYCHNALVFAPDKTVLQSLKEIQTFDKSLVVPTEYVNWLDTHLKFHFLDNTGTSLNVLDKSSYNIIISNTQKIIIKKQHKQKSATANLFSASNARYKAKKLNAEFDDLYEWDTIESETDLQANQRFEKLTRIKQLGIYVDEAHHAFGNKLAKDMMVKKGAKANTTSLRFTINQLALHLRDLGTKVVGCYNYTGTPYAGKKLLPEVVYAYGLKPAIDNKYLKKVRVQSIENSQSKEFVKYAITEFWERHEGKRYEGKLPKIAFFAPTIESLSNELKPHVEEVLSSLDIDTNKILVNVGNAKLTSNDDLREFKNLDNPNSKKQFILLVNKGKEGWNCRSLFSVGLFRKPKSKVFVLQATMRCLRSIGQVQETGHVYLSKENEKILADELASNFRVSIEDLTSAGIEGDKEKIRVKLPIDKVKLKRVKSTYELKPKKIAQRVNLEIEKAYTDKYKITLEEKTLERIKEKAKRKKDLTHIKEKRAYSQFTLVAEIARYLNHSPIKIQKILAASKDGIEAIVEKVNEFNEVLHDHVIPKLFNEFYDLIEKQEVEEEEIEIVKPPKDGDYYEITVSKPEQLISVNQDYFNKFKNKTFHLDKYYFDSKPELDFFNTIIKHKKVAKVYFTGMLTHGQTDFVIKYIDPETNTVRSYYPDFLVLTTDGTYYIVEIKGDNKIDDEVVQAKALYAQQLAASNQMYYAMIKGSKAKEGIFLA